MREARKKFLMSAMIALFVLLSEILAIINGVNYTMASADADVVTQMIAQNKGSFGPPRQETVVQDDFRRFGPMGPDSPEIRESLRYFTAAFDSEGEARLVAYEITAVSEEEALEWAKSLASESTGWSRATYRYRVYEAEGVTYVTVIDQGRELLSSWRILRISIIGEISGLVIAFLVLLQVSRKLFRPLEEADRKQKKFMADAEKEFKVPLTVIRVNTELLEKEHGSSNETQSINRQVKKMTGLVGRLGNMAIFADENKPEAFNLSALIGQMADEAKPVFETAGLKLVTELESAVEAAGEEDTYRKIVKELLSNAEKFSCSEAKISLSREKDRIILRTINDTKLPDMDASHAFDRFVRLENAAEAEGAGLGLSYVREWVQTLSGRCNAKVENGLFHVRITL